MNRINLAVPYAQKDAVKAMGARWDAELRTWWATEAQCRAHPGLLKWTGARSKPAQRTAKRSPAKQTRGPGPKLTERRVFSLAGCTCRHVAPWEDCEHTDPTAVEAELDRDGRPDRQGIPRAGDPALTSSPPMQQGLSQQQARSLGLLARSRGADRAP